MILLIDNYDSFTTNLAQYRANSAPGRVVRNDAIDLAGVAGETTRTHRRVARPLHPTRRAFRCR